MRWLLQTMEIWLFCFGLVMFFMCCGFLFTLLPDPFGSGSSFLAEAGDQSVLKATLLVQAGHLK